MSAWKMPERGFERFIAAWYAAQSDVAQEAEVNLNFEDFALLASILTAKRRELLKVLRQQGPLSGRKATAAERKHDEDPTT